MCALTLLVGASLLVSSSPAHKWKASRAKPGLEHKGPCAAPPEHIGVGNHATFAYRVQQPFDVELLGRLRAHYPRRFPNRDRDIFLVRARGKGAGEANEMISRLRNTELLSGEMFACNRIATLTGVRTDGAIPREDLYNEAGNTRVWGVLPDWERRLWHLSYPRSPQWSNDFNTTVRRIQSRSQGIQGRGKHPGVVITGWRYRGPNAWKYGRLARAARLDAQVIQTQGECQMSPGRFAHRARRLLDQYKGAGVGRSRLAMQVSFSANAGQTSLPHDVSPQRAAACTRAAYAAGVRSFLLWAYPRVIDEYFRALPDYIRR